MNGATSREKIKVSSNFIQWSGLAAVVAGAMYTLQGIVILFVRQRLVFISFSDYLIDAISIVASLGTLAAIVGLHALQRESYGRLGTAGSLVSFVGFAFRIVVVVLEALGTFGGVVVFVVFLNVGTLTPEVGLVLLGVATLRARVLPSWFGVLLIAGLPVTGVLSGILGATIGAITLGAFWVLVGYVLLSNGSAPVRQPSRVS